MLASISVKRDLMMMKNLLFALALLGVALWTGCATGGGGHGGGVQVSVADGNVGQVAVTLTLQFTATVTGTSNHAVTWSVRQNGSNCSTCGTIDANGLYTAPVTAPASAAVDIVATSQADSSRSGSLGVTVLQVTVNVTPKLSNPVIVAKGSKQQFSARALPDVDARAEHFTWSLVCDAGANLCGTIDAGTGLYTAPNAVPNPATAHVTATSTIDATGFATSDITIANSRLSGNSTYAFRLSGYDATGPIAIAGNFATSSSGAIIGGTQDELTSTASVIRTILNTSTLAIDSNVHGTLTLNTSAGGRIYKVAFNADGDGRMIELDGTGRRASGEIIQANTGKFKTSALPAGSSFVFGLTGIDPALNRAGFAGLFKPDGAGGITAGMLDINENGTISLMDAIDPLLSGYDIQSDGRGTMSLTDNDSGKTYNYAVYVTNGVTSKAANPLTLFAISTDDPQVAPAVSGTIVFQDPDPGYVNSEFTDFWVAGLTGVDSTGKTKVSLTNGSGDGSGKLNGFYDFNNAGTSSINGKKTITNYAYAATAASGSGKGRYELDLLGDPTANPVVAPVHFVLYSSALSRGFLLQIDTTHDRFAVYTGTMDPQPIRNLGPSELGGSLALATANAGSTDASQVEMNLLMQSLVPDFTLTGAQDETDSGGSNAAQALTGTYTVSVDGTGTMKITPSGQSAQNYVTYVIDNPKPDNMIQHFLMMNVDPSNTDPAIIVGER
jgi:hypothetical protein